jgi:hypothetical protein
MARTGRRGIRLRPSGFVRVAGLVGIAGGFVFVAAIILNIVYSASGWQQTSPTPIPWLALPAVWLFYLVALLGLHAFVAKRVGGFVWIFGAVATLGALMLLVGGLGISYVWYTNSLSVEFRLTNDPVGEAVRYNLYAASFLGYPILGVGLLGTGWLAARSRALGRLSWLPAILGGLSLAMYFVTDMGAPSLLRNTGTPGLLVMVLGQLLFGLVWAGSWIVLGGRLWQGQDGPAPTASTVVASN